MTEEIKQQSSYKLLVAAIDFGTTYSGYAYSFKDTWAKVVTNKWPSGNLMSHKAPTALLLNPDQTFNSFGYEAEKNYSDLAEDGDECEDYYFFHRFKMILKTELEKRVNRKTKCIDENKKELDAIVVFTHCIRYLKDHLLEQINKTLLTKSETKIEVKDITFVITVPAIWDDTAKMFMRKAAEAAEIPSDQLLLALEPEAASIYCQHMHLENPDNTRKKESINSKYMVLDIGGGTADITIHQLENQKLVELIPATGGEWGGTCVDKAFHKFLENILGEKVMKRFSSELEYKDDYFTFWQGFETKKRNKIGTAVSDTVHIRLPLGLEDIVKEVFNYKQLKRNEPIKRCIEKSKYNGKIEYKDGVIWMPSAIFKEMFYPTIRNITTHLEGLFKKESGKDVNILLMVGGFADNELLQSEMKKTFRGKRLVIPEQADLAVLKGAVYFGHIPDAISKRVARYTYGIQTWPKFDRSRHDVKKKEMVSGEERCRDVFLKFISKGDPIEPGLGKSYIFQSLQNEKRKLECGVFVSNSENPTYIDEKGCCKLGTLEIPIGDRSETCEIEESIIFGETEIRVKACNFATGERYEVKFDLLAEKIEMPDSRTWSVH
ncbi:heat shock 70 kDa protein 12A-like [Saccostrea echinata]|uniref:heat shock 70 kDa protein 12A-like n=1 Tax=Saccostrea echinata TaxID=191078 RepID=UPI002A80E4F8|nr:heat shock 70 kDa protein 12A-like [Saccostrea echinata]